MQNGGLGLGDQEPDGGKALNEAKFLAISVAHKLKPPTANHARANKKSHKLLPPFAEK